jgi:hypothetical protein
MTNHPKMAALAALIVLSISLSLEAKEEKEETAVWANPNDPTIPADFALQGEYIGEIDGGPKVGCQVIALDKGEFQAVMYPGGLPGAGWDRKNKILMAGKLSEDGKMTLVPAEGRRWYRTADPATFSATPNFPPNGHRPFHATIAGKAMKGKTDDGKTFTLTKTLRKSPTLGAKPPKGAIVLFDGTNKDQWYGGRFDEEAGVLTTNLLGAKSNRLFNNYSVHLEFMTPYRPAARGEARGNSGFYQVGMYEVQITDSFGMHGVSGECGGLHSRKDSDINMCFPPLTWQTYDVDFTNAVRKDGKIVKNARITVRLNGVVVQNDVELGQFRGRSREKEGVPGPLVLQGHRNPMQFRNIWVVER